jgi:hypothetical protein
MRAGGRTINNPHNLKPLRNIYVLARMDIVGFSDLSNCGLKTDPVQSFITLCESVNSILDRLNKSSGNGRNLESKGYGDTLDIYFKSADNDVGHILLMLDTIRRIQFEALIGYGLIIKGSIVKGDLTVGDSVFTGNAMVDASMLEKTAVGFGIIISDVIFEELKGTRELIFRTSADMDEFLNRTIIEHEGIRYLNYLEADPLSKTTKDNVRADLRSHKSPLMRAIDSYQVILSSSDKTLDQRTIIVNGYIRLLEYHNSLCVKYSIPEEAIGFQKESNEDHIIIRFVE